MTHVSYLDCASKWTAEARVAYSKLRQQAERTLQMKRALGMEEGQTVEDSMRIIYRFFIDEEARQWWDSQFGLEKFFVDSKVFFIALDANQSVAHTPTLASVLDPRRSGHVSIFSFAKFLALFGAFSNAVANFIDLEKQPYFYPKIKSRDEAFKLLRLEQQGCFLVRITHEELNPRLCISYLFQTKLAKEMETTKVVNSKDGFAFASNPDTWYPSVSKMVEKNKMVFVHPLLVSHYDHPSFIGDSHLEDALQLLQDAAGGTYVIHLADEPSKMLCHFVRMTSMVRSIETIQLIILPGNAIKQGDTIHASLEALVEANSKWLLVPWAPKKNLKETYRTSRVGAFGDGSFEKIIEKLYDGSQDPWITRIFLLTYRNYATSYVVLHILREKFESFKSQPDFTASMPMRLKIINFIKIWITDYFWDISHDPILLNQFRVFIQEVSVDSPQLGAQVQTALQKQIELKEHKAKTQRSVSLSWEESTVSPSELEPSELSLLAIAQLESASSPGSSVYFSSKPFSELTLDKLMSTGSVLDFTPQVFAEQLTLIEHDLFVRVRPYELLHQGWLKKDKEKRSPNVLKMARFSTKLSRWIVTEIVGEEKQARREKICAHFVSIAKELEKLHNYNAIMEILAAFSNAAVGRLAKMWEGLTKNFPKRAKELEELWALMRTEQNWVDYRNALSNAAPPKIPYMGLVLTDLVFIEEGNNDRTSNGEVNWTKCQILAEVLNSVALCQQESYFACQPNEAVCQYLFSDARVLSETDSYKLSLAIEPRERKE